MTDNKNQQIVTRFAPSPTGLLHVGSVRTALFNYIFAKKNGGKFLLRIEDTDAERSKKEYEENIISGMKWLGLNWDNEEFPRQSERKEIYKKYIQKLLEEGKVYISKETIDNQQLTTDDGEENRKTADSQETRNKKQETKEENSDSNQFQAVKYGKGAVAQMQKEKRESVIRFKNTGGKVSFKDEIRGDIEFDVTELGDFVVARDVDDPLYHLAVVIDDFEMGVTHVIRGEDGISNTPRQILIQRAIGAPQPIYAHLPLILGADKSKMSKRHGAVSMDEYKKQGYLPEAIVNFLALMGWNPGDDREVFTMDELIKEFSIERIQKSGAVFNIEKLNWLNKQHIKRKSIDELAEMLLEYLPENLKAKVKGDWDLWKRVVALERDRIEILSQIGENIECFFELPEYPKEKLLWKPSSAKATADKSETDLINTKKHLESIIDILSSIDDKNFTPYQNGFGAGFTADKIKELAWPYAEQNGRGNVLWPWRMALSGRDKSPDPFALSEVLGKEETIKRLKKAIEKIE